MFMRISTYKIDPSKIGGVDAAVDEVRGMLKSIAGLRHGSVGRDDDGNAAVIGIWESEEAANAAEETVANAWKTIGHLMTAPPERRGYNTYFHLAGQSF